MPFKNHLIIILLALGFFVSCTKQQLKRMTLTLSSPVEQSVFHKHDTIFITGDLSYKKEIKDIGFFCAMEYTENDSTKTFFQRTILPVSNPYKIQEYYVNEFDNAKQVTLYYGKRHVKSGQIYELQEIHFSLEP